MYTPPLHHPVPQHRVNFDTVAPQYNYAQQPGYENVHGNTNIPPQGQMPNVPPNAGYPPQFNPINLMGNAEIGKQAFNYGQQYITQSIDSYGITPSSLRYYFQVTNAYVRNKLLLVLFPWWPRRNWVRQLQPVQDTSGVDSYAFPSQDLNAPDMYIPLMAFITHLVVIALEQGVVDQFHPDQFGAHTSKALGLMILELVMLKVFTYLLACSGSSLLDLCAYSGYKYVGITVTSIVALLTKSNMAKWLVFAYTSFSTAFFMLRSLKYILLPSARTDSTAATVSGAKRQQRIYFLFFYGAICQVALMWLLL
ncbi:protein transporter [Starmerella bacillaris]|uniref:Protein YIF1 n=1 Tax=Starmerella bacillaris TaxID=1247836 RepID=A0AAV5RH02_STABA|nr:protein transporter [Starmerella bacillaris]